LKTGPVTKSAANQRYGRVGRTFPGKAYGLYREEDFKNLEEYSYPDTYNDDISKDILDMLYAKIPQECMDNPMEFNNYSDFAENCVDVSSLKLNKKNSKCNNLYINSVVDGSEVQTVDDYLCDGEKFRPVPEHLLDDLPLDSFITSRNKLLALGLLGTYSGYLASKLPSYTNVEGARMILACSAYGISTSDALTMAVIGAKSRKDYIISDGTAQFKKLPRFDIDKIIEEVISESNLKKYYFGSVQNFINLIQDDFIEGLIIMKYIVLKIRNYKKKIVGSGKKPQKKSRPASKPKAKNRFEYISNECEKVGLIVEGIGYILADRVTLHKAASDMGLLNNFPSCDFNSPDIVNTIMRLKKCILSGYKCNVATFDQDKGAYITSSGLRIKTHVVRSYTAKKIIYSSLFMKQDKKSITYSAVAELISSMDGIF